VATNVANNVRLAAITGGGTVAANATSYAAAAARAWLAVSSAWEESVPSHVKYGVTADTIDVEAGPIHGPLVSSEIADA